MNKWILIASVVILAFALVGCAVKVSDNQNQGNSKKKVSKATVGTDVEIDKVKEFYYTISTSTCPAFYQRYYFYVEGEKYMFFHETREGEGWPLSSAYTTKTGTVELNAEQWNKFFGMISGGVVINRKENTSTGGAGPYLYLYWDGDNDKCQQYSFEDRGKMVEFENYCKELAE